MIDEHQYDCIVVGSGISGISFAHYLHRQGKKVLILEKENRVGGQVYSTSADCNGKFWCELGAHTCYNSYTHLLGIVEDIARADLIQPLGAGSYVTYDDGNIKKIIGSMSIFSLLCNVPKIFFSSQKGKTVKEYFGNIVGKKNYEKLFTHLFRAVLSQNADEYPAQKFLKRRKGRNEKFPRKYSFKQGLSSFIEAIIQSDQMQVKINSQVANVSYKESAKVYNIELQDGQILKAKYIAFATDPQTTGRLVKDIAPRLSHILADIPLFWSESLNVIVPKEKLSLQAVAGIIPISDDFLSAVSRDLVDDDDLRSFTFHFAKGAKTESEKNEIIYSVLNISQADVVERLEVTHVLPSLGIRHLDITEQVDAYREDMFVLGNYFHGLSLEDCVQRSYQQAETLIGRSI